MRKLILLITIICLANTICAQTCPTSIRVGSSCGAGTNCTPCTNATCCHNCPGTVDVVSYETYVKRVLPQEWLNCWGSQINGMNSLQAGAVAIRSYTIPRISALVACHGPNYDICRTTCCHVYSTSQFANSNTAVDNTVNMVLVSGTTVQLTEYAAEQNNHPSCGDGMKGNGTASWPCTPDAPCSTQNYNGHGRGMCQNGSARWATGLNFVNSSCTWLSPHAFGTKTWQEILTHYYLGWTLATCGTASTPACNNDNSCIPLPLTINTSGTCINTACGTVNATPPSPDIPFLGGAGCATPYLSGRYDDDVWFSITPATTDPITVRVTPTTNLANFDVVIGLYQGNCTTPTQVACSDLSGVGVTENLIYTPAAGTSYWIRVFSYGIGSGFAGNFDICVFSGCASVAPSDPTSNSPQCGSVTITRTGSPPAGETWYWQGTNCGISTSLGSGSTYTATSSGTYYIRAFNNSAGCWSANCGSVTVTVNPAVTPIITISQVSCSGSTGNNTVSFNSTISNGGSSPAYLWSIVSGTGTPVSVTDPNFTLNNTSNGTQVQATLTSNANCANPVTVSSNILTVNCIITALPDINGLEYFRIIPNPNTGLFTVRMKLNSPRQVRFNVRNQLGQDVFGSALIQWSGDRSFTIDLTRLAAGAYFLETIVGKRSFNEKIIIHK